MPTLLLTERCCSVRKVINFKKAKTIVRWSRKATDLNILVDPNLRHICILKDSRAAECDIVKVASVVAQLFYYGCFNNHHERRSINMKLKLHITLSLVVFLFFISAFRGENIKKHTYVRDFLKIFAVTLGISLLLFSPATALAEPFVIDTTVGWSGVEGVAPFGDGDAGESYGQTFIVPVGNPNLKSLSFWLEHAPLDTSHQPPATSHFTFPVL